ncbi:MAG: DUF333 domain-containing protein [Anaerolineae bacterium]|nr:MAG: DUF333 domain-containing protein [Anaerolineae bacterium]
MSRRVLPTLFVLFGIAFSSACGPATPAAETNLPNPASVFCEENGGRLEFRQDASGGTYGMCIFPDGSECEEWAYFREECAPGDSLASTAPAPTAEVAADGWLVYRDADLGYSFHYPADAVIVLDDNPLDSLTILGPLVGDDHWPQITISHPRDRDEFRPPEDADLLDWLTAHNLLGDEPQPDAQIAGVTAIHLRHERSPQSYAYDRYYFAVSGQLYMIVIGHAGDVEDWDLYTRFLESFQFDS